MREIIMKKSGLIIVVALLLSVSVALADKQAPLLKAGEPYYEFAPGEVLVKFQSRLDGVAAATVCAEIGATVAERSAELDFYRVALSPTMDAREAVAFFRGRGDVEWANFNYIAHASYHPNDEYYAFQWPLARLNMEPAWDITRGASSVVVAVCDMGFYFAHEDWAGILTTSPRDAIGNDSDPTSTVDDSHAEHVAGTIFAATNNTTGIAGMAPLCTLMPVRVLDDSGSGSASQIANGISWAATHGADVINLSLGFPVSGPPQDPGPPLSTAIAQAASANAVVCAATGNEGEPYIAYPAAYATCIAVGATGYDDAIAPYSNRGAGIDVVAPGGNTEQDLNHDGYDDGVLSTLHSASDADYYGFWQGTSMATPHVAGLAALLLARGMQPAQVRQALQETAVDLGAAGLDQVYGYGRINPLGALQWNSGPHEVTLLSEGFETAFPPTNWQVDQTGATNPDGWKKLSQSATSEPAGGRSVHGGADAAFHNDDDTGGQQIDWLTTPAIVLPAGASGITLKFWQRNYWVADYYTAVAYHGVLWSTNNINFAELTELDQVQETWAEVTIDLTSFAGQTIYIAFLYKGDYTTEWYVDDVRLTAMVTGAAEPAVVPAPRALALGDAYPNPFNSAAVIPLELPQAARVELAIYNILGEKVATLLAPTLLNAGTHRFTWNAGDNATGLYFVRLTGENAVQTKKLHAGKISLTCCGQRAGLRPAPTERN